MIDVRLQKLLTESIKKCIKDGSFEVDNIPEIELDTPKRPEHGDLATNIAMVIASKAKKRPLDIANAIVKNLPKKEDLIQKVSVAPPGFINIVVAPRLHLEQLREIEAMGEKYGTLGIGTGKKLQVEFVSANPTGPLHIGHGRGAVYGDVLGNIMKAAGYDVTKEYYVNDAGGQIRTLGRSIYLRFLEVEGKSVTYPQECYQGDYIVMLARELASTARAKLLSASEGDAIEMCGEFAATKILGEIKRDLAETGVIHDLYFHENRLHTDAAIDRAIQELKNHGHIFEHEGALWFKSTAYKDDKDRVLRKSDGELTYFAADIAYHKNKFDRGFDRVIDIWGADHAGYVDRMRAAVAALGYPKESYDVVLIQLVNLVRGGEVVSMSTRSATYETLEDVRKEVGRDVCRYFFLMRSHNSQLDFDLELAKKETPENPVFYIQYAHARIASVFRKAKELGKTVHPERVSVHPSTGSGRTETSRRAHHEGEESIDLSALDLPEELTIARLLGAYPHVIGDCVATLEPHRLSFYLMELAKAFQGYYSRGRGDPRYRIISNDAVKTQAKLYLLKNCQIVLQNALGILGISAPEEMIRNDQCPSPNDE